MTAALVEVASPRGNRAGTASFSIRPAPLREPCFDDELGTTAHRYVSAARTLPFAAATARPVALVRSETPRTDLPEPALWGRRLLIGLTETAAGRRPLQQLAPLLSLPVMRGLGAAFEACAQRGRPHWSHAATVRSVHSCEPADGVAELCGVLRVGGRFRAAAMRLEVHHGRWRCTKLLLG